LSCGTIKVASRNKLMMNPKRSEINTNTFTAMERTCLKRMFYKNRGGFLEMPQRKLFSDSGEDFSMSFYSRE